MTEASRSPAIETTEAGFTEIYRDTVVTLGKEGQFEMPLADALKMEAMACPADPEKRSDPKARLAYMARLVGRDSLLPEHQHLLPDDEPSDEN